MLNANFAGELFGPGQPLDANRYFIILPDAFGCGKIFQAVGRPPHSVPKIQLRRHRSSAISTRNRAPGVCAVHVLCWEVQRVGCRRGSGG